MEYSIELHNVDKSFGNRRVVKDLTLSIPAGKITGFLGVNGSGKTTLMRMMCGLLKPDNGSGRCCGFDIFSEAEQIKPLIGDMTQYTSLYETLTVRETLECLAKSRNVAYAKSRIDELMSDLSLRRFSNESVLHLPGGWKQRVSLAASLLHSPKIILLDEPTAGVALTARRIFWEALDTLSDKGITILVSTHYMDEAERCHNLAWMAAGKLLTSGPVKTVMRSLGLTTFAIKGPDLNNLKGQFSAINDVEQTVIFSNTLYVTGRQCDELLSVIRMLPERYKVEKASATFEASFNHLMANALPAAC